MKRQKKTNPVPAIETETFTVRLPRRIAQVLRLAAEREGRTPEQFIAAAAACDATVVFNEGTGDQDDFRAEAAAANTSRSTATIVEMSAKQADWVEQAAAAFRCKPGDFLLAMSLSEVSSWPTAEEALPSIHDAIRTFVVERHIPDCDPEFRVVAFDSVAAR